MPDEAVVAVSRTLARMPFWKKESQTPASNGSNGNGNTEHNNGDCKKTKEKINYKARLEHKQYLVRNFSLHYFNLFSLVFAAAAEAQSVKRLGLMSLKRCATELTSVRFPVAV